MSHYLQHLKKADLTHCGSIRKRESWKQSPRHTEVKEPLAKKILKALGAA